MNRAITLIFIVFSLQLYSQTIVTQSIYSDTVWKKSGSPFIIKDTIAIFQDVTLKIEKGVEILVDNNMYIDMRGILLINGDSSDKVKIHSSSLTPTNSSWIGIRIRNYANFRANYVDMENCKSCLNFSNYYTTDSIIIKNITFRNNYCGIESFPLSDPIAIIDHCLFENNYYGFFSSHNDRVLIKNSVFKNNQNACGSDNQYSISLKVDSCSFFNNDFGIAIAFSSDYGYIKNTKIYNNNVGLKLSWSGTHSYFSNNHIYDNKIGMYLIVSGGQNQSFTKSSICNNSIRNIEYQWSANTNLSGICWCTNDSIEIQNKIKDGHNNLSLGLVVFEPIDSNCRDTAQSYVENYLVSEVLKIYPNPTDDLVFIDFPTNFRNGELRIIDIQGDVIQIEKIESSKRYFSVKSLKSGFYILNYYSDNKSYYSRLVKY